MHAELRALRLFVFSFDITCVWIFRITYVE